jgi:hypothetical protein
MIAVTTFSKTGYIVYTECPIDIEHEKIEVRDFFQIPNVQNFLQYLKNVPLAQGHVPGGYNYNYDLWRFSRKVFAQYDVLKDYKGKVFWLDADLYFRKPVPEKYLNDLFEDKPLVFLGREGFYTETGFVGFDTEYDGFKNFLDCYIGCLQKGTVFTLKRWHDCEIFDWARKQVGYNEKNLSPFFKIPDDKKMSLEELDVIHRSGLGEYIIHFKGKRKDAFAA